METNLDKSLEAALPMGQRWYDAGSVEEETIIEAFDLLDWLLPQFEGRLASKYVGGRTGDVTMERVPLEERPPLRFGRLLDASILFNYVLRNEEARRHDVSGKIWYRSPLTSLTSLRDLSGSSATGLAAVFGQERVDRPSLTDYLEQGFEEDHLRAFADGYLGIDIDIDPTPVARVRAAPKKQAAAKTARPSREETDELTGGDPTEKAILREFRAATDRLAESADSYHAALAGGVGSFLKGFMKHYEDRSFDKSALTMEFYWSVTFESDAFLSLLMEYFVQRHEFGKKQVFEKVYGLIFEGDIPANTRAEYERVWRSLSR
jgi:hypothetical protein